MVSIKDNKSKILENLFHYIYVGKYSLLENGNKEGSVVADLLAFSPIITPSTRLEKNTNCI